MNINPRWLCYSYDIRNHWKMLIKKKLKSDVDVASISSSQKTFTTFLIMWKKKWSLFWTVCYIPPNYPFPDSFVCLFHQANFIVGPISTGNEWPDPSYSSQFVSHGQSIHLSRHHFQVIKIHWFWNGSLFATNAFILCDLVLKTAIIFGTYQLSIIIP